MQESLDPKVLAKLYAPQHTPRGGVEETEDDKSN